MTGLRLLPSRVRLTHLRECRRTELSEFFGDDIQFGASADEIAFAASIRDLPVISTDPYLNQLMVSYCEEALTRRRDNSGSFRSNVENAIAPLLPHGKARAAAVARQLGVSQRTFCTAAVNGRADIFRPPGTPEIRSRKSLPSRRSLDDFPDRMVAWLSGSRGFLHAFKRWTGKTPREARSHRAFSYATFPEPRTSGSSDRTPPRLAPGSRFILRYSSAHPFRREAKPKCNRR